MTEGTPYTEEEQALLEQWEKEEEEKKKKETAKPVGEAKKVDSSQKEEDAKKTLAALEKMEAKGASYVEEKEQPKPKKKTATKKKAAAKPEPTTTAADLSVSLPAAVANHFDSLSNPMLENLLKSVGIKARAKAGRTSMITNTIEFLKDLETSEIPEEYPLALATLSGDVEKESPPPKKMTEAEQTSRRIKDHEVVAGEKESTKAKDETPKVKSTSKKKPIKKSNKGTSEKETPKGTKKKAAKTPSPRSAGDNVQRSEGKHSELSANAADVVYVNPRWVHPLPNLEVRLDKGNVREMCNEIKAAGKVLTPLACARDSKGKITVLDGHRRLAAVMSLIEEGWWALQNTKTIPVVLEPFPKDDQELCVRVFQLNQHKPLNPLESAILFKRLLLAGRSERDIASLTGKRVGFVKDCLLLINASDEVKARLKKGELSMPEAVDIAKQVDSAKDEEAGDEVERIKLKCLDTRKARVVTPASPSAVKSLLSQVAIAYSRFCRSKCPAKQSNETWVELEEILQKARNMQFTGKLS